MLVESKNPSVLTKVNFSVSIYASISEGAIQLADPLHFSIYNEINLNKLD